jgi:hypothetical protein
MRARDCNRCRTSVNAPSSRCREALMTREITTSRSAAGDCPSESGVESHALPHTTRYWDPETPDPPKLIACRHGRGSRLDPRWPIGYGASTATERAHPAAAIDISSWLDESVSDSGPVHEQLVPRSHAANPKVLQT